MPKITYIEHSGKEHQIEMPVGYSIMEGAIKNSVPFESIRNFSKTVDFAKRSL